MRKPLEFCRVLVLFGHFGLHFTQTALHFAHRLKHALELLLNGQLALNVRVLRKYPHARALGQRNRARIRLQLAGNQLEQRGLSASVHADQPHAAARLEREIYILQDAVHRKGLAYILKSQEYHFFSSFGRGANTRILTPVS